MIYREDIAFRMPKDRELQFPAMSALQSYVNCYQFKMKANCVLAEMPDFQFRYSCDMSEADWEFFHTVGLELRQERQEIEHPDAIIDLRDHRIHAFYNNEKHAAQICSALAGVEGPPFPKIRHVQPDYGMKTIMVGSFNLPPLRLDVDVVEAEDDKLPYLRDGTIGCFVGLQSWQTYLAASMGIPVVEILLPARGLNWLSKWLNPLYRIVEADKVEQLLPTALSNIREGLKYLCQLGENRRATPAPTLTVASTSSATTARAL